MNKSEQTAARYVIQFLIQDGQSMLQIARGTGIPRSNLEDFYRAKAGSDMTPKEISKLEKLHNATTGCA